MQKSALLLKNLRQRYWLAIALVAVMVLSSGYFLQQLIVVQAEDASTINLAGRQRMLSEKVARLVLEHRESIRRGIDNPQTTSSLIASELTTAASLMLENHRYLVSRAEANLDAQKQIFDEYFLLTNNLDERVIQYTRAALSIAKTRTITQLQNQSLFLFELENSNLLVGDLDRMVSLYEAAAIQRVSKIENQIYGFAGLIFFILLIEVLLIFRPFEQMIKSSFEQISSLARKNKESSERMRIATDAAGIGIWELDLTTKEVVWDDWMIRLYGLTPDTFEGARQTLEKGVHPADLQRNINELKAAIRGEEKFDNVFRVFHPDGQLHHLRVAAMAVKDESGQPIKMLGINYDVTELVESEKKVKQAVQRMRLAADSAGIGIWDLDIKTNELIWDDWMIRLYGLSRENFKGAYQAWEDGVHPDDIERAAEELQAAIRGEAKFDTEFRVLHPNGEIRYIKADAIVVNDETGKPTQMIGTNYDITERVETEGKLHATSQRVQVATDSTGIGIWELDLKTNELIWDDWMIRLYGLTRESFKGAYQAWEEGVHPDDIERAAEELQAGIRGEKKFDTEFRVLHPNGEVRHIKAAAIVLTDDNGQPTQMIGTNYDITNRVESEKQLKKTNQRMRLAADSAEIGMWELDLNTNELSWDDWMFKIFKVNPEDFSGAYEAWANTVHPEDIKDAGAVLQASIEEDKNLDTEFRIVWPNDEIRHIKAAALIRKDKQGKPYKMTGINYDVTEFKRSEEALIAAKNQAEEATRAKSAFLASMSHEIRTPMNGVLGMLRLLANSALSDEQKHRTEVAKSSAESLLVLINDILDFSKIEADKMDLEFINFDLRSMFDDFAEGMAQQAQAKGLELILDIVDLNQSRVVGDPGRIRQIASNLVGNAIKFTEAGEVLIKASLKEQDNDNWRFELSINDTGIGVKPEDQEKLFTAFEQVDASTTRHYGGTGLGLAIVKRLCRLMGGDVSMSSRLGVGSEFKCHFLLGKSDRSHRIMPRVDISGLEILVVDDNKTNREVLEGQLIHWGANITLASSAKEALKLCAERADNNDKSAFDIALLDYQMPEMDGVELGTLLSEDERFKAIKLIMMTSMSFQGDAARMAKIGFSGYFPKPATTTDLFDALNVIVEDGDALAEAEPLLTRHYLNSLSRKSTSIVNPQEQIDWPENARVLIVEDNRTNQMVAQDILKLSGLKSEVASNGQLALEQLQNLGDDFRYSLILMDCQMPIMDGYETTRRIRRGVAGDHNRSIPIIAMTAGAMKGDREKCITAGMNDYLTKPIDPDVLINKSVNWIFYKGREFEQAEANKTKLESTSSTELVDWNEEKALSRVRGQSSLLIRLIESFVEDHRDRLEQLENAVISEDFNLIIKLAHTEKGVAGNLSASKLQGLYQQLETAAKDRDNSEVESLTNNIKSSSKVLTQRLDAYVSENMNRASNIEISGDALSELLQDIRQKIEDSMFIEVKELDKLGQYQADEKVNKRLSEVSDLISRFEFQDAKKAIDEILSSL